MKLSTVTGIELEYDVVGSGEPVLFISPVLADGFLPLIAQPSLADRYQLIRYHKRGWVGSTHTPGPVSVADHAADAGGLLGRLEIARAHVVGHSSGAAVAAQLAVDAPERVVTVTLLELSLLSVSSGEAFRRRDAAFESYGSGEHKLALAMFLSAVSGLEWATCRALLDERIPGAVAQALKDADIRRCRAPPAHPASRARCRRRRRFPPTSRRRLNRTTALDAHRPHLERPNRRSVLGRCTKNAATERARMPAMGSRLRGRERGSAVV